MLSRVTSGRTPTLLIRLECIVRKLRKSTVDYGREGRFFGRSEGRSGPCEPEGPAVGRTDIDLAEAVTTGPTRRKMATNGEDTQTEGWRGLVDRSRCRDRLPGIPLAGLFALTAHFPHAWQSSTSCIRMQSPVDVPCRTETAGCEGHDVLTSTREPESVQRAP